jgi:ribonuclease-3
MDDERLERAEHLLGYRFRDRALLVTALTHPSFVAEHVGAASYDRLEFLGDAALGLIVAEHLYRTFPDEDEGQLSRRKHAVIAGDTLSLAAEALGIADLVSVGKGVRQPGAPLHASVLENTLEALIGAVYLDGGAAPAQELCRRVFGHRLALPVPPEPDPKGRLQELAQGSDGVLPEYRIVSTSGEPHDRTFRAEVLLSNAVVGRGTGRSKQAAEKAAAVAALAAMAGQDAPEPEES